MLNKGKLIFIFNLYFSILRRNNFKIFLIILNFLIISKIEFINFGYKEDIPKFYYDEVNSSYPGAKNFEFNFYKRSCRKIFKYKPNNKKDLVILAYEFQNKSLEHNLFMERSINKVLNSFQYSIPLAHFICFVPEKSNNSIIVPILKKFKIEIIIISNSNEHITNRRFIESYKYLKKNKKLYERVMHIDIDDIFIFGDIFATIGKNDLFVNYNCNNESRNLLNCKKFFGSINKIWFKQNMNIKNTNKTEVVKCKAIEPITIIAGVIIGGINFSLF